MLSLIFLSLFSSAPDGVDNVINKTVVIADRQQEAGLQLHLCIVEGSVSGVSSRRPLIPFAKIQPLLQVFLYPDIGYGELFKLLEMERDPLAVYKFQRVMIQILVDRVNNGCIESNKELCRYLLGMYSQCSCDSAFIDKLRAWREELKRAASVFPILEQAESCQVRRLPPLSTQGKVFLQNKSGVRDHDLSDEEFLREYIQLPEALRRAVCAGNDGGRNGFDQYLDETYGVSLSALGMLRDRSAAKPAIVAATSSGWGFSWGFLFSSCFGHHNGQKSKLF